MFLSQFHEKLVIRVASVVRTLPSLVVWLSPPRIIVGVVPVIKFLPVSAPL